MSAKSAERAPERAKNYSTEEILDLQDIARRMARKWGYADIAEDFAQEAAIAALTRGQVRLEWVLCDYLRREYGDSRSGRGRIKQLERRFGISLDEPAHQDGSGELRHSIVAAPGVDPGPVGGDWRSRIVPAGRDGPIFDEVIESEGAPGDIAEELGVTESRVSQIRSRLKKEVVSAAIIEERYAEYRDDPDSSKLLVRWIKL